MTKFDSHSHAYFTMPLLCCLFAVMLAVNGCGGGGGNSAGVPAGSTTTNGGTSGTALSAAAGFPVMVDPQGVSTQAVTSVSGVMYTCYSQTGSPYLMLARSNDNGTSWHTSIIDFGGTFASLAVDGTNVYVAYVDQSWKTLKFAASPDEGTNWTIREVDVTLKSDPSTRVPSTDPTQPYIPDDFKYTAFARSGDSFFIAYFDRAHASLRLARSDDRGVTWRCTTLDNGNDSDGDSPSLTVDGQNIYISYVGITGQGGTARDSIYVQVSHDLGATWTKRLASPAAFASGYNTSVAVRDNRVFVSYFNALERNLKCAVSTDYGATWALRTVDQNDNVGRYSSLLLENGTIYISYSDWSSNSVKIAQSNDGGNTWTTRNLVVDAGYGSSAAASIINNEIYLFYFSCSSSKPNAFGAMLAKFIDNNS